MKPEVHHGKWNGGKGSTPRPTNQQKYAANWDRIFGKKELTDKPDSDIIAETLTRR
jgi:hypothetical protein